MPTVERSWRLATCVCVALCASALGLTSRVAASPLLELAGGLTEHGGFSARATSCGAAASYFNPALLGDTPMGLTVGLFVLGSRLDIGLGARPASAAVPAGIDNSYRSDGARWDSYPLSTSSLQQGVPSDGVRSAIAARPRQANGSGDQTQTYEAVGIVMRLLRDQLALGFYGLIPNSSFTRLTSFYVDEREQYFSNSLHPEMYADRMSSLALALAAAWRINDQWSVGIGTTLNLVANANAPAYVEDASKLQDIGLALDAQVNLGLSPHGGISYKPFKRLRLTGTVHAPQQVEFNVKFSFLLGSGVSQASSLRFVFDYMPWQVGLGAAFDVVDKPKQSLAVTASAVYGRWSQYVDRQGERPLPAFGFDDTITGAVGGRYRVGSFSLMADLQYKPTPVRPQRGATNYVDNDRVGVALGAEYAFALLETQFGLGVSLASYHLLKRTQRKLTTPTFADGTSRTPALVRDEVPDDAEVEGEPLPGREGVQTNNPGWPGFSSVGWVGGLSVYLKVQL